MVESPDVPDEFEGLSAVGMVCSACAGSHDGEVPWNAELVRHVVFGQETNLAQNTQICLHDGRKSGFWSGNGAPLFCVFSTL